MNRNRFLKESILEILYNSFKENTQVKYTFEDGFSGLLNDFSEEDISLAIKDLRVLGYIDMGISNYRELGFVHTSDLTQKGIKYVTEFLLEKKNTTSDTHDSIDLFLPWDYNYTVHGDDMLPCFRIDSFAHALVRLIDLISKSENSNIAMFGLFAPWGRGKSYLIRAVSEHMNQRMYWETRVIHMPKKTKRELNVSIDKKPSIAYDTITFNAWKYQDTPALWAYLYETLVQSKSIFFKVGYSLKRNFILVLRDLVLFAIPLVLTYLISPDSTWRISAWLFSGIGFLVRVFLREYDSILTIFKKYSRAVSFKDQLGVRSLIEEELKHLFIYWIPKNKVQARKIVLFVDDLDRCRPEIMLDIIESLRLILEQDEIKKRLIVVCCIDSTVLSSVMMTKYQPLHFGRDIEKMIKDQFDKLFLATISLPPISQDNIEEYLDAFTEKDFEVHAGNKSLFYLSYQQALIKLFRKDSINTEPRKFDMECRILTDSTIIMLLKESISKNNLDLTPRQVNRLYYRCIFACLLLYFTSEDVFHSIVDKTLIDGIVIRSYGTGTINESFRTIIDMVVPFSRVANDD